MIPRAELTGVLRNASDIEETHVEQVTEFLREQFDWTGFDRSRVIEAKRLLEKISSESKRHHRIIEQLLKKIADSDRDGF